MHVFDTQVQMHPSMIGIYLMPIVRQVFRPFLLPTDSRFPLPAAAWYSVRRQLGGRHCYMANLRCVYQFGLWTRSNGLNCTQLLLSERRYHPLCATAATSVGRMLENDSATFLRSATENKYQLSGANAYPHPLLNATAYVHARL